MNLIGFELAKLCRQKKIIFKAEKYWCNYYTGEPIQKWKLVNRESIQNNWMEFEAYSQYELMDILRDNYDMFVYIKQLPDGMYSGYVDWLGHHIVSEYICDYNFNVCLERTLIDAVKKIE